MLRRDARGSEFDGSDSKQIYLPLANDRLDGRPLLMRVDSNPVQMLAAVNRVVVSIDPEIMVTSSTLEEALRRAVAAGSLACTAAGAQPSSPTREAVDVALERIALLTSRCS